MFFKKKEKKPPKILEALQIEVSSKCNLKCIFCPTTYQSEPGERKIMDFEMFKKLQPYFSWTKWVYLQGWGEPLLNPEIWKMVEILKQERVQIGFTTNGTLLTERNIKNILDQEISLLSISISGGTEETHNKLRANSSLQDIFARVKTLVKLKEERKLEYPIICLSYMLTKESIEELPLAVKKAYQLGANDFYVTNLDYVFNEISDENKVFTWEKTAPEEYLKIIEETIRYANSLKFSFRHYPLTPQVEQPICALNPSKIVFVTSNGDVTPCTYLGRMKNPRYRNNKMEIFPRVAFGNIQKQSFEEIWFQTEYKEFRSIFEVREKAYQELLSAYTDFEPNLLRIKDAEKTYENILATEPLPKMCQTCTKTFGI